MNGVHSSGVSCGRHAAPIVAPIDDSAKELLCAASGRR